MGDKYVRDLERMLLHAETPNKEKKRKEKNTKQ